LTFVMHLFLALKRIRTHSISASSCRVCLRSHPPVVFSTC
jgi:hypothetical protein